MYILSNMKGGINVHIQILEPLSDEVGVISTVPYEEYLLKVITEDTINRMKKELEDLLGKDYPPIVKKGGYHINLNPMKCPPHNKRTINCIKDVDVRLSVPVCDLSKINLNGRVYINPKPNTWWNVLSIKEKEKIII